MKKIDQKAKAFLLNKKKTFCQHIAYMEYNQQLCTFIQPWTRIARILKTHDILLKMT